MALLPAIGDALNTEAVGAKEVAGNVGGAINNAVSSIGAPLQGLWNQYITGDTGGDAKVIPNQATPKPSPGGFPGTDQNGMLIAQNQATINGAQNQFAQQSQQIQALLRSLQPAQAPTLNLDAIKASAAAAAGQQVNPLYTQQLNQYLQNEAAAKAQQEAQNQLSITGAQQGLQNTLAQNQQAEQFAGQQNALQQGNINAQAANYQLQSGNAENAKLAALQQAQGQGGLSGSGLGAQQLWMAENQKNVEDAQQQGAFQYNRDVANLATSNTFAELAQSSKFAQTQEQTQEAQSKFNLNSYLRQAAYAEQQYQDALEAWKQQALGAAQQNYIAQGVSSALGAYRGNQKVYAAGVQAYAPQLQTASLPQQLNQLSYQA